MPRVQITADGYPGYPPAMAATFGHDVDFATIVKHYAVEGTATDAAHRYSPSKVTGSERTVIRGRPATDLDPATGAYRSLMIDPSNVRFAEVFERVWNRYKNLSGLRLSSITHEPGTPWYKARHSGMAYLSNDEIAKYFRNLASKELPTDK